MAVYILQVPHQRPPKAWEADDENTALALLSTDSEDFDDMDEAVGHDMSYGIWAHSKEGLLQRLRELSISHQYFAAESAIFRL